MTLGTQSRHVPRRPERSGLFLKWQQIGNAFRPWSIQRNKPTALLWNQCFGRQEASVLVRHRERQTTIHALYHTHASTDTFGVFHFIFFWLAPPPEQQSGHTPHRCSMASPLFKQHSSQVSRHGSIGHSGTKQDHQADPPAVHWDQGRDCWPPIASNLIQYSAGRYLSVIPAHLEGHK